MVAKVTETCRRLIVCIREYLNESAIVSSLLKCRKFNTSETVNENNISSKRVLRKEAVLVDTASYQLCSCMNITINRRKQIAEQEL